MGPAVKSLIVKRSVIIDGHRTSISLEDAFWNALRDIAHARNTTLYRLVAEIDSKRQHDNLSSALRLFVLGFYREQCIKQLGTASPLSPTSALTAF
jgi:predicted DNA-binding ribbon-helix-helix protein